MPIPQPYFLNGTSFIDSTSIYTNSGLTEYASDGWYSDGTVIRQQVDGVLQPPQPCPSCGIPCGDSISTEGGEGIYKMSIDTGSTASDVGAIIVRFNPYNVPDGIKVDFNGVTYNTVSSEVAGWLGSVPSGLPIFLGLTSSQVYCPFNSIVGGPFTRSVYQWDGTTFVATGGTETVIVDISQDKTTMPDAPGMCTLVIPKPSPTPSNIEITCYGICVDTTFEIQIECPKLLKKIKTSVMKSSIDTPSELCILPLDQSYYVASVNGVYPYLGLYDWVFSDPYGINVLPDGYYKTNNLNSPFDTIRVGNGTVKEILNICP